MPPHGLYPVPRHHLVGAATSRPVFNTMDFQDEGNEQEERSTEAVPQYDGASNRKVAEESKERKKKKKHRTEEELGEGSTSAHATQRTASPNSKVKRSSKKAKNEENEGKDGKQSTAKKRKRESDGKVKLPVLTRTPSIGGFVIGTDILKSLQSSMGDMSANFEKWAKSPEKTSADVDKDAKKGKKKADTKSKDAAVEPVVSSTAKKSKAEAQKVEEPKPKKQKWKSDVGIERDGKTSKTHPTSSAQGMASTSVRKSHVPFPPKSQPSTFPVQNMKTGQPSSRQKPEVIVIPETPPSKTANQLRSVRSNTPFLRTSFSNALRDAILPSVQPPVTPILSSMSSSSETSSPSPASIIETMSAWKYGLLDGPLDSGTSPARSERLISHTPVAPRVTPKSHSRHMSRASSGVTSLPSSGSVSLPSSFDRVGKPYARSGAGIDPFVLREVVKKDRRETHQESDFEVFNSRFSNLQHAVNFSDEQDYLDGYLAWQTSNHSIAQYPCLGNATGCNPTKERILAAGKEKGKIVHRFAESGGNDPDVMLDASVRARKAEDFLITAVRARIPVPIGRLAGTYQLFCPKYVEQHFDRYSLGLRNLTIYTVAGSENHGQFTARLSIPPRPTAFAITPFDAPPHAGFRTTLLTTNPEGVKIEAVFLGNGYLQLRLDLNLLLRGKATKTSDGKMGEMDFLGVHEKAVQWIKRDDGKDEVEEEGKKVFAKYGGGNEE